MPASSVKSEYGHPFDSSSSRSDVDHIQPDPSVESRHPLVVASVQLGQLRRDLLWNRPGKTTFCQ
jgi:hypothetical protein